MNKYVGNRQMSSNNNVQIYQDVTRCTDRRRKNIKPLKVNKLPSRDNLICYVLSIKYIESEWGIQLNIVGLFD